MENEKATIIPGFDTRYTIEIFPTSEITSITPPDKKAISYKEDSLISNVSLKGFCSNIPDKTFCSVNFIVTRDYGIKDTYTVTHISGKEKLKIEVTGDKDQNWEIPSIPINIITFKLFGTGTIGATVSPEMPFSKEGKLEPKNGFTYNKPCDVSFSFENKSTQIIGDKVSIIIGRDPTLLESSIILTIADKTFEFETGNISIGERKESLCLGTKDQPKDNDDDVVDYDFFHYLTAERYILFTFIINHKYMKNKKMVTEKITLSKDAKLADTITKNKPNPVPYIMLSVFTLGYYSTYYYSREHEMIEMPAGYVVKLAVENIKSNIDIPVIITIIAEYKYYHKIIKSEKVMLKKGANKIIFDDVKRVKCVRLFASLDINRSFVSAKIRNSLTNTWVFKGGIKVNSYSNGKKSKNSYNICSNFIEVETDKK
ncbi:MAG: hypothetical protein JXJ04_24070 [Spirochaetales bacterium]|nr:hypothetical protein [Spirochaetales bacterium]